MTYAFTSCRWIAFLLLCLAQLASLVPLFSADGANPKPCKDPWECYEKPVLDGTPEGPTTICSGVSGTWGIESNITPGKAIRCDEERSVGTHASGAGSDNMNWQARVEGPNGFSFNYEDDNGDFTDSFTDIGTYTVTWTGVANSDPIDGQYVCDHPDEVKKTLQFTVTGDSYTAKIDDAKICRNKTVEVPFEITNDGCDLGKTVTYSITQAGGDVTVQLANNTGATVIHPGTPFQGTVSVTCDGNQYAGTVMLKLTVTSSSGATDDDEATLTLTAPQVIAKGGRATVCPGNAFELPVDITNNGDCDEIVEVSWRKVGGNLTVNFPVTKGMITVGSGATETFTINGDVPADSEFGTADIEIVLKVAEREVYRTGAANYGKVSDDHRPNDGVAGGPTAPLTAIIPLDGDTAQPVPFIVHHSIVTNNTPRPRDLFGKLRLTYKSGDRNAISLFDQDGKPYRLGSPINVVEEGHEGCGRHDFHTGDLPMSFIGKKVGEVVLTATVTPDRDYGGQGAPLITADITFRVVNYSVIMPEEIDADTAELFVSAVFTPFFEPDYTEGVEGKAVEFQVFKDGNKVHTLNSTVKEGVASVKMSTDLLDTTVYQVKALVDGHTRTSENDMRIIPGEARQIKYLTLQEVRKADGKEIKDVTVEIRDVGNNLVKNFIQWEYDKATSPFANSGRDNDDILTNGLAKARVLSGFVPERPIVRIRSGGWSDQRELDTRKLTGNLSVPNADYNIDTPGNVVVTLSTDATDGTQVWWYNSAPNMTNAPTSPPITSSVVQGGQATLVIPYNQNDGLGVHLVSATIGAQTFTAAIGYSSRKPFQVRVQNRYIAGNVTTDGQLTFDVNAVPPGETVAVNAVGPDNRTAGHTAFSNVTVTGRPMSQFSVESGSSLINFLGLDASRRGVIGASGIGTFTIQSTGQFTPDYDRFVAKTLQFRVRDVLRPASSWTSTITLVDVTAWDYFTDAVGGFLGQDTTTGAGLAAQFVGGFLLIGDIGSIAKNVYRAAGFSEKEVNLLEVGLSGASLAVTLGGVTKVADVPISAVKAVVIAVGRTELSRILVAMLKSGLQNGKNLTRLVTFSRKVAGNVNYANMAKLVYNSEEAVEGGVQVVHKLGSEASETFMEGMAKVTSEGATLGGSVSARGVSTVLANMSDEALQSLKASPLFAQAIEGMAKSLKHIDAELVNKILRNPIYNSGEYTLAHVLVDMGKVADSPGFIRLARSLANRGTGRWGFRYELQATVALFEQLGKLPTFLSKLVSNAAGKTDIDAIIDGVYYQFKRSRAAFLAGRSEAKALEHIKGWVSKAKLDGATSIKFVTPSKDEVPAKILAWLEEEGIELVYIAEKGSIP